MDANIYVLAFEFLEDEVGRVVQNEWKGGTSELVGVFNSSITVVIQGWVGHWIEGLL